MTPNSEQDHNATFSRTCALIDDIKDERYGRPLVAALSLCNDLEDMLHNAERESSQRLAALLAAQERVRELASAEAALREFLWAWDSDSVQGALLNVAIHGCGETEETPRIVAAIQAAREALSEQTDEGTTE